MSARIGVAVIGCGLIGERRARTAAAHPRTALRLAVDTDATRARAVANEHGADADHDWRRALARDDVQAVVISTPNAMLLPIAGAALQAGRHVLLEKPMGRNAREAAQLAAIAHTAGTILKVGFNHRFHPAIARAHELFQQGAIGRLLHMRARYGHGSRPGCEAEWRADAAQAGGGELLDQGVHVIDLFQWFAGAPLRVFAELQAAVWQRGPLEDNAFALLRFTDNVVGQLHVSMTQWKNLFSHEVHGETGALCVEGLGGSYGEERLIHVQRRAQAGPPDMRTEPFAGLDRSWQEEWADFVNALDGGVMRHGRAADGLAVMRTLDALYAAAAAAAPVETRLVGEVLVP